MNKSFSKKIPFSKQNVKLSAHIAVMLIFIFSAFPGHGQNLQEGKKDFAICAACHNIGTGRLVGPDLKGVTERHSKDWLKKFINNSQELIQSGDKEAVAIFEEYNKIPMPPNNFSDEQLNNIIAYIVAKGNGEEITDAPAEKEVLAEDHEAAETEIAHQEEMLSHTMDKGRNYGIIFWISFALIFLALLDLVLFKFVKARFVHIIIIIISVIVIGEIMYVEATSLGRQQFYSPTQPIEFSHKIHAGQNQIDCRYCHSSVDNGRHAGIPSTQLCMNCHNVVKEGKVTGKTEIEKIYASLENKDAIEWIKVHNLPDHVFFSHAQHTNVGQLDCVECHGAVEEMDKVQQVEDLSMGWCIDCHRQTNLPQFQTNEFYKHYEELHAKLKSGEINRVTVQDIGGNDCQKCHY
jgi:cytochrome c2